jgi:chemotaxis protein methyltransferase CheR
MQRRLKALASRFGAATLVAFVEVMERDPAALAAFKNAFTINVSEFLRDPSRWQELTHRILPALREAAGSRPLKVWSAGCSYGAEPYSLAMLLEETSAGRPYSIVATDIDETILARARAGAEYRDADLRHVDAARRSRFFTAERDGTFRVKDALKARITFRRHDLLSGAAEREVDLIVCRNVVIYFTEEAKRELYQRIYAALRPSGVLFVGGTEVVSGARELGLEPVLTSFYRRKDSRMAGAA